MEISYTNFELDSNIYGQKILCGMIDKDGKFLEKNAGEIKKLPINLNQSINWFLKFRAPIRVKQIVDEIMNEFEMPKEMKHRKLKTLSESELIKILSIRALTFSAKTIIFDSIDTVLTWKDLNLILKTLKKYLNETNKRIIFRTNKVDNIVMQADRYIIIENDKIIYNDSNFDNLPELTETSRFVELANERGAKLKKYKDSNDLLKAVYRSVK